MKVKTHVRVGRDPLHPRRSRVQVSQGVNHAPLTAGGNPIPTVAFALELDLPDEMFKQAERVLATVKVPAGACHVAAEVVMADGA